MALKSPYGGFRGLLKTGAITMSEIVFLVEEDPEGGFTARALGESIFTQADDMKSLREAVRDAVNCHFSDEEIRLVYDY